MAAKAQTSKKKKAFNFLIDKRLMWSLHKFLRTSHYFTSENKIVRFSILSFILKLLPSHKISTLAAFTVDRVKVRPLSVWFGLKLWEEGEKK